MTDEATGVIFDIVHCSFVDGHGIRTTVFFKGCPLRCVWCCNPEGQRLEPEIKLVLSRCNGCGKCIDACPTGAIAADGEKISLDRSLCTRCGDCVEVCQRGALDWFGRHYTVTEVYENVVKDVAYYRNSGGGVTLGGGEATFQPEFVYALMKKLQTEGIHVAIDTCGHAPTDESFQVLAEADLLLFDLKGLDPGLHLEHTGRANRVITENLRRLGEMGKPIIIRLPLIPGHTTDTATLEAEADLIAGISSVERVDLIPYHDYSKVKYGQLGLVYGLDQPVLSEEEVERIRQVFVARGLQVQIGG